MAYESFEQDIQGKDTSLVPVIIVQQPGIPSSETDLIVSSHNDIYLSTNNISLDVVRIGESVGQEVITASFKPLLLNIPSIKQSVDVENRRFKISSVTLSISNYEYEGKRFSDLLQDSSMINQKVDIYWKSQSSKIIVPKYQLFLYELGVGSGWGDFDFESAYGNECFPVYTGTIRRISHTTDVVTIELEDTTERNHKDLPQTLLPSDETILDKYKNKPIPMVYGYVDRSPLVFSDLYSVLTADSLPISGFTHPYKSEFEINLNSLWVDVGHYINVVQSNQYNEEGSEIKFTISGIHDTVGLGEGSGYSFEAIGGLHLKCHDLSKNFNVSLSNYFETGSTTEDYDEPIGSVKKIYDGSQDANYIDWSASRTNMEMPNTVTSVEKKNDIILLYDSNDGTLSIDFRTIAHVEGNNNMNYHAELLMLTLGLNFIPSYDFLPIGGDTVHLIGLSINGWNFSNITPYNQSLLGEGLGLPNYGYVIQTNSNYVSNFGDFNGQLNDYGNYHSLGELVTAVPSEFGVINALINFKNANWDAAGTNHNWDVDGNNAGDGTSESPGAPIEFESEVTFTDGTASVKAELSLSSPRIGLSGSGFDEIDLLREVNATKIFDKDFYASVEGRGGLTNPAAIIRHILETELGYSDFDNSTNGDYNIAFAQHTDMNFAFTIHDKQISSKKLIEDIAKSTLMFPYFGNDGVFRFNSLRQNYDTNPDGSVYDDFIVIPESEVIDFSFSKTKPEQLYSKYEVDYYYDYAQKDYLKKVEDEFSITDADHLKFYGLEDSDDNIGKLESAYVRDGNTARMINELFFDYYKNQHLILKLKLPVKYIGLSVGDVIKFDKLLGGITAYGIDYTEDSYLFDQKIYPLFFITSLQKNTDSVSIELIQLHYIDTVGEDAPAPIYGCTDPNAGNYNPDAVIDNGTCWFYDADPYEGEVETGETLGYIEFSELNNWTQFIKFQDFYSDYEEDGYAGYYHHIGKNIITPSTNEPDSIDIRSAHVGDYVGDDILAVIFRRNFLKLFYPFASNTAFEQTLFIGDDYLPVTPYQHGNSFYAGGKWGITIEKCVSPPDGNGENGVYEHIGGYFYNYTTGVHGWNFTEYEADTPNNQVMPGAEVVDAKAELDPESLIYATVIRIKFHHTNIWSEGQSLYYKPPSMVYGINSLAGFPFESGSTDDLLLADVNQDGIVNILDAVAIVNHILSTEGVLTGVELGLADVNQDGIVNILDVVLVVGIILG